MLSYFGHTRRAATPYYRDTRGDQRRCRLFGTPPAKETITPCIYMPAGATGQVGQPLHHIARTGYSLRVMSRTPFFHLINEPGERGWAVLRGSSPARGPVRSRRAPCRQDVAA